jgi:hypothetical protein
MRSPTALLQAWENGLGRDFARCGLALLAAACPDSDTDALASLNIGERDRQLLRLREAVFGPRMSAVATCPRCHEVLEFEVAVADLQAPGAAAETPLSVDHGDWHFDLRVPDSRDLIAAADEPEHAEHVLFARSVVTATRAGSPIDAAAVPDAVRAAVAERLAAADPQADLQLALTCTNCSFNWHATLDIVSFFWVELDAWAGRLLRDVHALASAYGWSERDILALSPTRRRHYLRLAGA